MAEISAERLAVMLQPNSPPRHRIVALIGCGYTTEEIAFACGVPPDTVLRWHKQNTFDPQFDQDSSTTRFNELARLTLEALEISQSRINFAKKLLKKLLIVELVAGGRSREAMKALKTLRAKTHAQES